MKKIKVILALGIATFISGLAVAQSSPKDVSTRISDVTVFMNGAQLIEVANIQLKEGENQFRLSGLTAQLDPNSIQVEGNSNYTILSVRHQILYNSSESKNPKVKALRDSLEEAKFKQQEYTGLKNVVQQERSLLDSNKKINGNNSSLIVEDLQDIANFFRNRLEELEYRWIELSEKEKKNNLEISRLQNQLNSMNAQIGTNSSEILVTIIADKSANTTLRTSYVVRNAGWYPVYDLRAEDVNSPVQFIYRAKVHQSTGRDWERVNLTISTGNPSVGGQIPMLYPWYVDARDPILFGQRERSREENLTPVVYETPLIMADKGASSGTAANYTSIQNNTVNTEFKISVPYDIPSDNQYYDVTMQTQSLRADYAHITIPKLDNDAFLRAQVADWAQYSLLPGESNIYFKGTFVGKGYIDPTQANDTLSLSLGRDRSVSVKREMLKEYSKTGIFGSKQQTSRAYEITAQNNKKQAIRLIIEDQLPISQSGEVEVNMEDISGGQYNPTTGKITWEVNLAPGATMKKQIRFTVKYPKKKYVLGL